MSWKMSLFLIFEILGLFVNTLIADDKFSLCNSEKLQQPLQMQLSNKQKVFLNFLLICWNLHQFFNTLNKKMTLIADACEKLETAKDMVS